LLCLIFFIIEMLCTVIDYSLIIVAILLTVDIVQTSYCSNVVLQLESLYIYDFQPHSLSEFAISDYNYTLNFSSSGVLKLSDSLFECDSMGFTDPTKILLIEVTKTYTHITLHSGMYQGCSVNLTYLDLNLNSNISNPFSILSVYCDSQLSKPVLPDINYSFFDYHPNTSLL